MEEQQIYEVTQANEYIKALLDGAPTLQNICIRGELSNYKIYPSGHHYFTLKDADSALRCVMFKSSAGKLRFRPDSGMKVIAAGRITVFPRDGAYQLYCSTLSPDGVGDLYVAFEQLKTKLLEEGLFDRSHKKSLPLYPERIAIITSSAGAAVHDMARARTLMEKQYSVLALIGDGALSGGLAYEGLNNAGASREPLIVILNDNGMSINPNVGAMLLSAPSFPAF